jgi:hypothetical protein
MPYFPQKTNPTHVPNWLGLAKEYGAVAAYRTIRDVASSNKFYANDLNHSYADEVLKDGPAVYFKLDSAAISEFVAADSSVDPDNATITGPESLTYVTSPMVERQDVQTGSFAGNALDCVGSPHTHVVSQSLKLRVSFPFTIESWAQTTFARCQPHINLIGDTTQFRVSLGSSTGAALGTGLVSLQAGNDLLATADDVNYWPAGVREFDLGDGDGSERRYNTDAWHHIVGVFDSATSVKLYVDGQLLETETGLTTMEAPADSDALYVVKLGIGASTTGTQAFIGGVCHVALYDHELDRSRINQHYEAMIRPSDFKWENYSGEVARLGLGHHRPGPRVIWGDPYCEAVQIEPVSMSEKMEVNGDKFSSLTREIIRNNASFGVLAGVACDGLPDDYYGRIIFDCRRIGTYWSGWDTDTFGSAITITNGFGFGFDRKGNPKASYMSTDSSVEEEIVGNGGADPTPSTSVADGNYALISCILSAGGSADDATFSVMKDHTVVGQNTGNDDISNTEADGLTAVSAPSLLNDTHDTAVWNNETYQGKIGPLVLFSDDSLTPEKMAQVVRAIKGDHGSPRGRLSTRRLRRPQRLYAGTRT